MRLQIGKELGYVRCMRRTLLALAFVALPLNGWAQGTAENQATFRSGVDLVTVSGTHFFVQEDSERAAALVREHLAW